ncbi:MAG TPA: FAD-dependent oxidoreductase [Acidobacteriota bacterium]|nr:FAD-dependent oxidoreductase [Acidobacteriota bacterium]
MTHKASEDGKAGSLAESQAVVVGAGAFGGWTALHLQESGVQTTLVDAWGPGHGLSSSGGETRVLRCGYGQLSLYAEMALRARRMWQEREERWGVELLHQRPILWIGHEDDPLLRGSQQCFDQLGLPYNRLSAARIQERFPDFRCGDEVVGLLEHQAGVLYARRACRVVADAFQEAGGVLLRGRAKAPAGSGSLKVLELDDGRRLKADTYLFACGPWMASLFDRYLEDRLEITRQEVFFFGPPPAHPMLDERGGQDCRLPVFYDASMDSYYGIPPLQGRGFKLASDLAGPVVDPQGDSRQSSPEALRGARDFLKKRLPVLAHAPLSESRVCVYTRTPDRHFVMGPHPRISNVFLAGGGSGHGFKHGPLVGEYAAAMMSKNRPFPSQWRLDRLL